MAGAELIEPLPPEPFSGWWLAGACLLLALAAALVAWPWLWRRLRRWRARRPDGDGRAGALAPGGALTARIDQIERAWRAGELTDRAAAQALAQVAREAAGGEAPRLTLAELRQRGDLPAVADLVGVAYPVEFGVAGQGDITDLVARARAAVRR